MSTFGWREFINPSEWRGVYRAVKAAVKPYVAGGVVLFGCAGLIALARCWPAAVPAAVSVAILCGLVYVIKKP